jgi:ADP-dependent NAD(P)H-hydrate dehydratase
MLVSPRADEPLDPGGVRPLDAEALRAWPLPIDDDGDKYSRGTVLIIGGSVTTPGAVLLAGRAALRMGAGRLQIATAAEAALHVAIALPEALVMPYRTDPDERLQKSIGTADAVVVGPGLTGDDVATIVETVLRESHSHSIVVLDAAAIMLFDDIEPALVAHARDRLVMTPNRQEARALADGRASEDSGADDVEVLVGAARRTGAVLASFGGVYAPDGRRWQSSVDALGLGTSGSGDVLAGLAGGAAARSGDRAQAACWATFAHLEAGRRLESRVGALGYLASDLVDELPACLPR